VVHLDQVVVDRLRDADAAEIVAVGARRFGQPVGCVGRVVAANVEKVAGVERAEGGQRPVQVFVGETVATRAEDAGGRVRQRIEDAARLVPEVDVLAREQAFDPVAKPDDLTDPIARVEGGPDDAKERTIDDGGRSARLPDDECLAGGCCQQSAPSLPRSVGGGNAGCLERADDRPQESRQVGRAA
jgi:hypothetical protein